MIESNKIHHGDCLDVLRTFPDNSIDMIITSPPYAERRKSTYGGIKESEYVDWFLQIGSEIKRVLKPNGSFFLNIKPHATNGERSLYVFDLVCSLKREIGLSFFLVDWSLFACSYEILNVLSVIWNFQKRFKR